jgi:hypothetical protein
MKLKAVSGIMLVLLLIGVLALAFNTQPTEAQPATMVYVDPPTSGKEVNETGQEFTVAIKIAEVQLLFMWRFDLEWNSSLLEIPDDPTTPAIVEGVSEGTFLNKEGEFQTAFLQRLFDGRVSVTCSLRGVSVSQAPSGSGTLATVTFRVKAEGGCPLHFNFTRLTRPTSDEDPTLFIIPHTAEDGHFKYPLLISDINGDGIVDILDGVIIGVAFGSRPGDPKWNPIADIAPEGEPDNLIDIQDIVLWATYFGKT